MLYTRQHTIKLGRDIIKRIFIQATQRFGKLLYSLLTIERFFVPLLVIFNQVCQILVSDCTNTDCALLNQRFIAGRQADRISLIYICVVRLLLYSNLLRNCRNLIRQRRTALAIRLICAVGDALQALDSALNPVEQNLNPVKLFQKFISITAAGRAC